MIRHSRLRTCAICGAVVGAFAVLIALERVAVQVFEDDMLPLFSSEPSACSSPAS